MKGQRLIRLRRITAFICVVLMLFGAMPAHLFEGVFGTDNVAKAIEARPSATVVTAPEAAYADGEDCIRFTGEDRELVTAGEAENGDMQYILWDNGVNAPGSDENWSDEIPVGTALGTYYVWYKAVGDGAFYIDSEPKCIPVEIDYARRVIAFNDDSVDPDFIQSMTVVDPEDEDEVIEVDFDYPMFYVGEKVEIVSSAMLDFYVGKLKNKNAISTLKTKMEDGDETIYTYTFTMPDKAITVKHPHDFTISPDEDESSPFFKYGCANENGSLKTIYTLSAEDTVYSGEAVTASVIESEVTIPEELELSRGEISYYNSGNTLLSEAPVEAGTYIAKVTVSSALGERTLEKEFTIAPKSFTSGDIFISISNSEKTYDGTAPTYSVDFDCNVQDDGVVGTEPHLSYGDDYIITVNPDKVIVGNYTIRISGINNYKDYREFSYAITEADVADQITFTVNNKTYDGAVYNNEGQLISVTAEEGSLAESLLADAENTDVVIEFYNYDENASNNNYCGNEPIEPVNAGKYVAKLTITNNNYTEIVKYREFEIEKAVVTVAPVVKEFYYGTKKLAELETVDNFTYTCEIGFDMSNLPNNYFKVYFGDTPVSADRIFENADNDSFIDAGQYTYEFNADAELPDYMNNYELVWTEEGTGNGLSVNMVELNADRFTVTQGNNPTYNGNEQSPDFFFVDTLTSEVLVTWANNTESSVGVRRTGIFGVEGAETDAGTGYEMIITPDCEHNYIGLFSFGYVINPLSIGDGTQMANGFTFGLVDDSLTYNGENQEPEVSSFTYASGNINLEPALDIDYEFDTDSAKIVGDEYSYTVTGKGNYTGSFTGTWSIDQENAGNVNSIVIGAQSIVYNGSNYDAANIELSVAGTDPLSADVLNDANNKTNNGTITYKYVGTGDTQYDESTTAPENIGTYKVTAEITTDNIKGTVTVSADFSITQLKLNVSIANVSKEFGTVTDGAVTNGDHYKSARAWVVDGDNITLTNATDNGYDPTADDLAAVKDLVDVVTYGENYKSVKNVDTTKDDAYFLKAGTYQYTLTDNHIGNFSVELVGETAFTVTKKVSSSGWIFTDPAYLTYDGEEKRVVVKYDLSNLWQGYDYMTDEVVVSGNIATNAGTYNVVLTPVDAENGNIDPSICTYDNAKHEWTIAKFEIKDGDVSLSSNEEYYKGTPLYPSITVKVDLDSDNSTEKIGLEEGDDKDYTVAYYKVVDNVETLINADQFVNVGNYRIKVTGIGNYTGTISKDYTILKSEQRVYVIPGNIVYDGKIVDESDFTIESEAGNQMGSVTLEFFTGANGVGKLEPAPINAGTYYVRATVAASDNYKAGYSNYVQFTIQKRWVTITPAKDNKVTYGNKGALDSTVLKYSVELAGETGNTGFIGTENDAKELFGDLLTVGKEISTTNVQHTGTADNYDVTIATNDAGTYEYEDFRSEKQIGEITDSTHTALPFNGRYKYGYSFQLYTPDEIGHAHAIDSISYHVQGTDNLAHKFDIYLMDVDTNFTLYAGYEDYFKADIMTKVYSTDGYTFTTGWNEFKFNSDYSHEPGKQVLVLFVNKTGSFNNNNLQFSTFGSELNNIYNYSDSDQYDFNVPEQQLYEKTNNYKNVIKLGLAGLQISDSHPNYELVLENPDNNVFTVEKKDLSTANITLKIGRNKNGSDAIAVTNNTVSFDSNRYYVFYDVNDSKDNDSIITENDYEAFTSYSWKVQPGTYEYEFDAEDNGNYTGEPVVKEWTITNRQMAVTVEVAEGNFTYTGEAFDESKLSVTTGVGLNKEELTAPNYTITYKYRKSGTEDDFVAGAPVNAGEYEVSAEITANGTLFNVTTATLTIEKKTITFVPTATSYTKVYGEDDPEYGYTFTGIVDADAGKEIYTGTISRLNAAAHEDANLYTNEKFDVSGLALTEEGAVNYVIGPYSTYFTLDIKPCQIKPENLIIKTPKIAYTGSLRNVEYEVVVNGKTVPASAYDVSGNTGKKVGTYNLEISAEGGNYYTDDEFEPVEGEWKIVEDERKAEFSSPTITVSDCVTLKFKFLLNEAALADEGAYFVLSSDNGSSKKIPLADAVYEKKSGKYVFSFEINPDRFSDVMKATIIFSDEVVADSVEYSVVQYANEMRSAYQNDEKLVYLLDAMMNYGASMQVYKNYKVESLANVDNIIDFSKDITINELYESKTYGEATGVKNSTQSISIGTKVSITSKYELTGDINDYIFELYDEETEITRTLNPVKSGSKYAVKIENLSPKNFDKIFIIKVINKNDNTEMSVSYSVMSGLKSILESTTYEESLKDIARALYYYNVAMEQY